MEKNIKDQNSKNNPDKKIPPTLDTAQNIQLGNKEETTKVVVQPLSKSKEKEIEKIMEELNRE